MVRLEELKPQAKVLGIVRSGPVEVVDVHWHGDQAIELTYKSPDGSASNVLVYRSDEPRLELIDAGRTWDFTGVGVS